MCLGHAVRYTARRPSAHRALLWRRHVTPQAIMGSERARETEMDKKGELPVANAARKKDHDSWRFYYFRAPIKHTFQAKRNRWISRVDVCASAGVHAGDGNRNRMCSTLESMLRNYMRHNRISEQRRRKRRVSPRSRNSVRCAWSTASGTHSLHSLCKKGNSEFSPAKNHGSPIVTANIPAAKFNWKIITNN